MDADQNIGKVIVAFTAPDPKGVQFVGVMSGYYSCPVAIFDTGDGRSTPWAMHLCREATPDEAEKFWRDRAVLAEAELRELKAGRGE